MNDAARSNIRFTLQTNMYIERHDQTAATRPLPRPTGEVNGDVAKNLPRLTVAG